MAEQDTAVQDRLAELDSEITDGRELLKKKFQERKQLMDAQNKVLDGVATAPKDVDAKQGKEVKLPEMRLPNIEPPAPTRKQKNEALFIEGFSSAGGNPRPMTAHIPTNVKRNGQ